MDFNIENIDSKYLSELAKADNKAEIISSIKNLHPADISEIFNKLSEKDSIYIFKLLDKENTALVFKELNEDLRERILNDLSSEDIAEKLVDELDTDDATDIISELNSEKKREVIQNIKDTDHAKDIVDLLRYDENTAGSLMAKEFISVNEKWTVLTCVKEMRRQAEGLEKVHRVFVVDDAERLKGFISLKKFLTTSTRTPVEELYDDKIIYVNVDDNLDAVASIMKKYDLVVIPVVDEFNRLVGIISIDDIVDYITDEAEKDYQLASGLSSEVETKDGIFQSSRARIPWLFIGLIGGIFSGQILKYFGGIIEENIYLVWFIPLIAAMGGNVGVQSSAIVVQGLANKTIERNILSRLFKESFTAILNGILLSILIISADIIFNIPFIVSIAVSVSLIIVMINASIIGSFIPFVLDKWKINPAIATGPFITTTNDILGVTLYFIISKFILGL